MFTDPALLALHAVLRTGSFEGAAAQLNVTPPAISQRIRKLEEQMGTPLIRRTTPCEATDTGARLYRHAEEMGLLARALAADLGQPSAPATLRLAVNADSLATWFIEAMAGVEGISFDLVVDDEDHSADWLRRGEVLAAISAHPGPVQGCDVHALGALRYHATCAPGFAARHFPQGPTAEGLARAPCLSFSAKDRLQSHWMHAATGAHPSPPHHTLPATSAFIDAARAGLGWGLNPAPLAAPHLADGSLVDMKPGLTVDRPLYWLVSRLAAPALADLTASVRAAARAHLVQPAPEEF
ncbi:LysR family transcriptional regulator ArgP [Vannielia litorea]|uniref:LysR family transcriptional regulator ArgP n=1 Tax=Vannielia litorea TaxID=1217970 RepID=UPI001C951AC2|nr:LysR family transcriptional regulator ArgP [Vannielia litorea]MBY6048003.1 LysR family transcriptional regulator ArgP [Vannielia litorea]MBY6075417.1 LysR family transcriptional regulator ArgP [Vannielia litorea]